LPSGAISKNEAIGFGALTGIGGTALLLVGTNPVVAALGAFNIALYAGAYTYSKKHTELNTWIGAVVGAIPPVMGWAAATGGSIYALEPLALATLMFLWQFPHFFALSWMYREDYARGQFQMVAVNDPLGTRSARLITEYSMYLAAFPFVTCALDLTNQMFMVEGVVINGGLLYLAHKFKQDRSNKNANNVFKYSLFYIMSMMSLYVFHSRMWDEKKLENEEQDVVCMLRLEFSFPCFLIYFHIACV
jgi:protoheme IX farnesyltransferase